MACRDAEFATLLLQTNKQTKLLFLLLIAQLAEPKCESRDLSLPKQVCVELVYGHAAPTHVAPAYPHKTA